MAAGFGREDAEEVLSLHPDAVSVLFVGHEPDFSQLVHDFTGARVDLRKGGVAAIELDGSRAVLTALMRPEELEAMAG